MKRKLYAKYNKRSRLIEFTFIEVNDDEAIYKYEQANIQAEQQNMFYRSEDYALICLGVIVMEGDIEEVGIEQTLMKDFPYAFDKIEDWQKPKYNQAYFDKMNKENREKIIRKANGEDEE